MLNPIIYSFTVKEFKRSTIQALLPFWCFIYKCCPQITKKPPEKYQINKITRYVETKQLNKKYVKRKNGNSTINSLKKSAIVRRSTEPAELAKKFKFSKNFNNLFLAHQTKINVKIKIFQKELLIQSILKRILIINI